MDVSEFATSGMIIPAGQELGKRDFTVDVELVDPYEGNARLVPNAKREDLKRVTLRDGAPPGQLVVTQRPGSRRLVLARGGNTRLEIVKELRDAYPDDLRWRQITVRYEPFVSELQIAVNVFQENDARGELLFIERALALCRVYELWCGTQPCEERATLHAFLDFFGAHFGKPPTATAVSRMRFTVETLYRLIPTALIGGRMTDYAVRRLIEYRNKLSELWVTVGFGPREEFEDYFYEHLARQEKGLAEAAAQLTNDHADDETPSCHELQIDYQRLSAALANEMARVEHIDVDESLIRDWIDDVLTGTPVEYIVADPSADGSAAQFHLPAAAGLPAREATDPVAYDTEDFSDAIREEHERAYQARQQRERDRAAEPPAAVPVRIPASTVDVPATAPATDPSAIASDVLAESTDRPAPPLSLPACREAALKIARRMAERNRFGRLVIPCELGIGYLIADTIVQGDDEPVALQRAAPWWVLVCCGLVLEVPTDVAERMLPEESLLRSSIASRQTELISHVMGSPGSFGRYLAALDDLDSQDFLLLMKIARHIIRTCGGGDFLWVESPSRPTPPRSGNR